MKTTLLFVLFLGLVSSFDPKYYPNNVQVLPEYTLYWKVEGDSMRIAMEVQTTGWIGFGIGEATSGSMNGADILFASVKEGKTTLRDMYALVKDTPIDDDCSNWEVVSGEESNGKTIVEAKRKLNTNDTQDRPFEASGRIIVAFGGSDTLVYHGSNRKALAHQWWDFKKVEVPNLPTMVFMNSPDYVIPLVRTTYYELMFPINLTQDVSVVAFEAIVKSKFVHHFLMYGTNTPFQNATLKSAWDILWAWAPGMVPLVVPPPIGFTFGPSVYRSLRLQIHYDNPLGEANQKDDSGVRLYYDTNLRPIQAGVLMLGDPSVSNLNPVPAGSGIWSYEYDCPGSCTTRFNQTLNIFGNFLHMHQAGYQMWGKQWRNGQLLRETNRIDFWDFGLQQMTPVTQTIEPGDRISTHCVYNRGQTPITFGEGSNQEMCIQFVYYFPKMTMRGFCGYLEKPALFQGNATICGTTPIMTANPTQLDPVGGDSISFGPQNPNSFVCGEKMVEHEVDSSSTLLAAIVALVVALFF